ncbi:hypothetical protein DU80_03380 [Methanosarcina mazei]|uniref:Uncharacterized protein n=1 Tax=Methanosarcina mazei TaxID=2209 RepID=A0A0F8GLA4_METMZ|nr:hypothetical protein DU31_16215 [Methanosarcina mazei]KKG02740.1 hypothetical protein DU40_02360 [Methanosarcina mazei]KKG04440.1 hypothetical protein DU47_15855 [Methanosarcina mazei]KKG18903.1 hypothetical protein DU34_14630 [Methanosarcina mazei]KKG29383.1 hypothetical protein DU49_00555 [Methanosarcina mazei]
MRIWSETRVCLNLNIIPVPQIPVSESLCFIDLELLFCGNQAFRIVSGGLPLLILYLLFFEVVPL